MQQATVNLLADMGAQPATLQPGLVAAHPVDRHHRADRRRSPRPPTARPSRTAPASTITGTATDTGGGVVAGVEVSTDGGTTWHPAHRHDELDLHLGRARQPDGRRSRSARPTTAATSARPAAASRSTWRCPCSICGRRRRPRHDRDSGEPDADRGRRQVQVRRRRHRQRHPLLQGHRQHRHPHRQPVDRDRHAAGAGHVHRRDRPPAGSRRPSPAPCRSRRTRPTSPPTSRPTATTRRTPDYFYVPGAGRDGDAGSTARRCTPSSANGTTRQRRLPLRRDEHVPDEQLPREQLLGRRDVRAVDAARAR